MDIQVSIIAGEILILLDETKGPMRHEELKYFLKEPMNRIYPAIGRLLREGLIEVKKRNHVNFISKKSDEEDDKNDFCNTSLLINARFYKKNWRPSMLHQRGDYGKEFKNAKDRFRNFNHV